MATKVTDEMIERVFSLYLNCCNVAEEGGEDVPLNIDNISRFAGLQNAGRDLEAWPVLTPMSALTDEKILELCQFVNPAVYGDYRYNHWQVERDLKQDWIHVKVKDAEDYFFIDNPTGTIKVYEYLDLDIIEPIFLQWYYANAVSIPIYFGKDHWANGKTPIELGIGIDGTIDRSEAMQRCSENFYGYKRDQP